MEIKDEKVNQDETELKDEKLEEEELEKNGRR